MVEKGYYFENITMKSDVNIFGDGNDGTWLRGTGPGNVVTAINVDNAQIDGFMIYHAIDSTKAGVYISGGSVTVSNNWIRNNINGIRIVNGASSIIRNNKIQYNGDSNNSTTDYGLLCLSSTPLITNNLISDNPETGIYMAWAGSAGARIINNTIVGNGYDGIWCYQEANVVIKNNIIVDNGTGISAIYDARPIISYNDVWGNNWGNYDSQTGGLAAPGPGDISEGPLFDPVYTDYYLSEDSPCVDAGDPDPVYLDIDGTRNDMGWHGGPDGRAANRYGIMSGFIFTTIGKVPVSEVTTSGASMGLANVSTATANDLHIPKYVDSPFGGNLWLHGLFGPEDDTVRYYQILVAKWTGAIAPSIKLAVPLTDSLTKTYYTILSDGTVKAQRYTCGPYNYWGKEGIYLRTYDDYWAHPDLKMIWRTGGWANGKYKLFYKAYKSNGDPVSLPYNTQNTMTIIVNNSNVEAEILAVKKNTGEVVQECGMIDVDSADENIQFVVKARHPQGYLRQFTLHALYGTNKDGGDVLHEVYAGNPAATPPMWYGETSKTYHSISAMNTGMLDPWETCAYQFRLNVYARTTNGYNYIKWRQFNDHYYINVGSCAWCGGADINHDGIVNVVDFSRLAERWLDNTCGPCLGN
ncbi:MAG: right-handed parallel beta-helix repeat-containing protein, partial [Anaerohalosphaera sp.]|nr:right-handed parallel beta-helix repeat-containing protein [Anaerohalosphaera sp.]